MHLRHGLHVSPPRKPKPRLTAASTIVTGVVRAVAVKTIHVGDVSDTALVNTLCIVEVAVAIIISSSALLRPVFDHITRGVRSITTRTGGDDFAMSNARRSQRRSVALKSFAGETDDAVSQVDKPLEPGSTMVTEIYCGAESADGQESEDRSLEDGHIYVATTTKITT